MNRREILKYAALATGAAISAPLVSTFLSGCAPDPGGSHEIYQPEFFSEEEFAVVRDLLDLILPRTDSPSATDVGVHAMVDKMVGKAYKPEDREAYKQDFAALMVYLTPDPEGKKFSALSQEEKMEKLAPLLASPGDEPPAEHRAFLALRQQAISYYLASEPIGKQFLTYLPVPGTYEGCITVEEAGGKAWAI